MPNNKLMDEEVESLITDLDGLSRHSDAPWLEAVCDRAIAQLRAPIAQREPIPMILHCPKCGLQHIDARENTDQPLYADEPTPWDNPPHKSHLCHGCGFIWRPCDLPTNGVATIATKGKNDSPTATSAPAEKGERAPSREPTEAMYNAARDWSAIAFGKPIGNFAARGCFQAMLDASPQSPPAEPADEQLNWELGEITKSMAVEWPCLPGWTLLPDARGRLSQISNLWAGFKDRLHAEPAAVAKWNHGCMVMAQNIDLWLPNCPQCGMPRPDLAAIPMPGVLPK